MVILENETLIASIHPMGAELNSLYNKDLDLEYIWNGNADFWPRHSPVLFPIVGGLIDDSFFYKDKKYTLAKHGFARDSEFELENSSSDSASFILKSTNETLKSYPFQFVLRILYTLEKNKLKVSYEVENPSDERMYFSIGTHPAFNVPLTENSVYEDYYLEFENEETCARHTLDGNILNGTTPYLEKQSKLPLKSSLFYEDAIIFKDLKSTTISIRNTKDEHGIHFNFDGFPYMGIWAAKDAPFVCIEPWCGIPDSENHSQKIEEKEGIIALSRNQHWQKTWSIECF